MVGEAVKLDQHYQNKLVCLRKLGNVLYSTALRNSRFHKGTPIETTDYESVAGPRVGQLSLRPKLDGERLYSTLTRSGKAQLRALFSAIPGWDLTTDPEVYWTGDKLMIEARWPSEMQLSNVSLGDINVRPTDGVTAIIGPKQDYEYHTLHVNTKLTTHSLIVGTTGSGKTETTKTILTQFARAEKVLFVIIDGKRGPESLEQFATLKNLVGPVANTPKRALGAMTWLLREMHARERGERDLSTPLHVLVDEFQAFTTEYNAFAIAASKLGRRGRGVNIHLHFITQRPDEKMWGVAGTNLRSQFSIQMIHRLQSHYDVRTITGESWPPAHTLCDAGDMYMFAPNVGWARVQVALATQLDINRARL